MVWCLGNIHGCMSYMSKMVYVYVYMWWICAMYMREACGSNVCMRGICIRSIIMDMLELFYMTKDKGRNMWLVWNDYIDMNK